MFEHLNEPRRALELNERAIDLLRPLASAFPDRLEYRLDLSRCYFRKANALVPLQRHAEAGEPFRESVSEAEYLVRCYPAVDLYRGALACHQLGLGDWLVAYGQYQEAEILIRQAVDIEEQLVRGHPSDPQRRIRYAIALDSLGRLSAKRGDFQALLAAYQRRITLADDMKRHFPDDPMVFDSLLCHELAATLLRHLGQSADAEQVLQKGLAVDRWLAVRFRAVPYFRFLLASDLDHLGFVCWDSDRPRARAAFREALNIMEGLSKEFPQNVAYRQRLASFLVGCPDSPAQAWRRAESLATKLVQEQPDNLVSWGILGSALYRTKQWDASLRALERSLHTRWQGQGWKERVYQVMALWEQDKRDKARQLFRDLQADLSRDPTYSCDTEFWMGQAGKLMCR